MVGALASGRRWGSVAAAFGLACLVLLAFATIARADGSPDINGSASSSTTLYGNPVEFTVSASNPLGQPYGYNLSYRVLLPAGVSYAGGGPVAPKQIADSPGLGETTLLFLNTSDLSPGATKTFTFDLQYDSAVYDAGESFPVKAQAFLNEDPRFVPKFDAAGNPLGPESSSFTGYTPKLTGIQTLKAIEVEIDEPSPEGEILRGVHDHQTVYTLKVTNNGINPTTGTKLDAYIPAGLEFLGCGGPGADHTTNAPTNPGSAEEYPGSGPIQVDPLAGCVEPESVETEVIDPDGAGGPLPLAVYTHVVWPVGDLTSGQTQLFPYRAAIPVRANTNTFSGTRPSAASGNQATNLDNNSGPEVTDETLLRTYAVASGTYQGKAPTPVSDEESLDRTAEDWVVHKSGSSGTLAQGQITTWTLTLRNLRVQVRRRGDRHRHAARRPLPARAGELHERERPGRRRMRPDRRRTLRPLRLGDRERRRHLDPDLGRGLTGQTRPHRDQRRVHDHLPDPDPHPLPGELRTDGADPRPRRDRQLGHHRGLRLRPLHGARHARLLDPGPEDRLRRDRRFDDRRRQPGRAGGRRAGDPQGSRRGWRQLPGGDLHHRRARLPARATASAGACASTSPARWTPRRRRSPTSCPKAPSTSPAATKRGRRTTSARRSTTPGRRTGC